KGAPLARGRTLPAMGIRLATPRRWLPWMAVARPASSLWGRGYQRLRLLRATVGTQLRQRLPASLQVVAAQHAGDHEPALAIADQTVAHQHRAVELEQAQAFLVVQPEIGLPPVAAQQ